MRSRELTEAYKQLTSLLSQLEGTTAEKDILRAQIKVWLMLQRRKERGKAADRGQIGFLAASNKRHPTESEV